MRWRAKAMARQEEASLAGWQNLKEEMVQYKNKNNKKKKKLALQRGQAFCAVKRSVNGRSSCCTFWLRRQRKILGNIPNTKLYYSIAEIYHRKRSANIIQMSSFISWGRIDNLVNTWKTMIITATHLLLVTSFTDIFF